MWNCKHYEEPTEKRACNGRKKPEIGQRGNNLKICKAYAVALLVQTLQAGKSRV